MAKRGSVLIIVLWSLFFLSALALAIDGYIRPRLDLGARLLRRARIHYYAEAGVKQAMLEIEKDETELYDCFSDTWCNNPGGFNQKEIDGGIFTIELIDEERKININKAPYDVLKFFFELAGKVNQEEAQDLADSIIDWRDEDDDPRDNGAEDGYYSIRHPGYDCKNSDFELLEELLLVKGMTREILDRVRERITVHGEGQVNINTADALVLESLGMTQELAGKIVNFRNGTEGQAGSVSHIFEDAGKILSDLEESEKLSAEEINQINKIVAKGQFCVRSDNFMGQSIGKLENRDDSVNIAFVYDRTQKRIRYWREI